jgi:hypothetical protein
MKPLGMKSSTICGDQMPRLVLSQATRPLGSRIVVFGRFNRRLFQLIARSGLPLSQWNHERIVQAMTGPNIGNNLLDSHAVVDFGNG